MDTTSRQILEKVKSGEMSVDEALLKLKTKETAKERATATTTINVEIFIFYSFV